VTPPFTAGCRALNTVYNGGSMMRGVVEPIIQGRV